MISKEITLVLPTKNHEGLVLDNLKYIDSYLKNNFTNYEIIVVSNGSSEHNVNLLKQKNNIYINHLIFEQSGKGFAVREGIKKSSYKYILICDADLSVDIKYVKKFFENGTPLASFVVGSRKLNDSSVEKTPLIRLLSGGIFTYLTKYYLGINISDTQCGFKLIDKSQFLNCNKYNSNDFFYDVELFLLAKKLFLNVTEVPVKYIHNNKSSISLFSDSVKMFFKIITIKKTINKIN